MESLQSLLQAQLFPRVVDLTVCTTYSTLHSYPHNPLQTGPMYFKTAKKCAVFGVCCEGIPRQVNYLVDEACDVGKGANAVIRFLNHFLEQRGLEDTHADNCVGQNKVLQV